VAALVTGSDVTIALRQFLAFLLFNHKYFLIFLHSEATNLYFYCTDATDFCLIFFISNTTNFYCYEVINEDTFWKTCLLHHILDFPMLQYMQFEIAVTSKMIYYLCMTSLNNEITFEDQNIPSLLRNGNKHMSKRKNCFSLKTWHH